MYGEYDCLLCANGIFFTGQKHLNAAHSGGDGWALRMNICGNILAGSRKEHQLLKYHNGM